MIKFKKTNCPLLLNIICTKNYFFEIWFLPTVAQVIVQKLKVAGTGGLSPTQKIK